MIRLNMNISVKLRLEFDRNDRFGRISYIVDYVYRRSSENKTNVEPFYSSVNDIYRV